MLSLNVMQLVQINTYCQENMKKKIRQRICYSMQPFKDQLISKGLFDVIVSTKKPTKFVLRISALASKKRWDQKIKALNITN